MEVVKRNLYSILCGVVAIVAVVLVFYPLGGMFEELRTKVKESETDFTTIRSLLGKEHAAPDVDLEKAEQRMLGRFPTPKVIEIGEAAVTKVQQQSLALLQEAMKMNQKPPLVPAALPLGPGPALGDFRIMYYRTLHDFVKRLNATNAPTQEEVDRRIEILRNEMQQNAGGVGDLARNDFEMELQSKLMTLADEMGRERANTATMYVSAEPGGSGIGGGALGGETPELKGLKSFDVHHPGIPTPSQFASPSIVDVWSAQLGLWVQEDIVNAIVATNANAQGVENAVVKRLIEIKVPKEYVTKLGRVALVDSTGMAVKFDTAMMDPAAAAASPDGAVAEPVDPNKPPKDPKASATGRICNPLYDVIHFSIVVDADAARFRDFMANLVSNRHITVLTVDLEGVDRNQEFQALYFYGEKPVVRMRLTCEALFFREWTLPLMPEIVKKVLNIEPPAATGVETTAMR